MKDQNKSSSKGNGRRGRGVSFSRRKQRSRLYRNNGGGWVEWLKKWAKVETYRKLTDRSEKEPTVWEQPIEADNKEKYGDDLPTFDDVIGDVPDEDKFELKNEHFFTAYVLGRDKPLIPGREDKGFHIDGKVSYAFRGRGGKDMAYIWHMLNIPKRQHGMTDDDKVRLHWIFDLRRSDIDLLEGMRNSFIGFVQHNQEYFQREFGGGQKFGGHTIDHWLQPENMNFGFHTIPTVGYLHMHGMVGPLTDFGHSLLYKWISLDTVLDILRSLKGDERLSPKLVTNYRLRKMIEKKGMPSSKNADTYEIKFDDLVYAYVHMFREFYPDQQEDEEAIREQVKTLLEESVGSSIDFDDPDRAEDAMVTLRLRGT